MTTLTPSQRELIQKLSPVTLRMIDTLATKVTAGTATKDERDEYDRRIDRCLKACDNHNVGINVEAKKNGLDEEAEQLQADYEAGKLTKGEYKFQVRELAQKAKAADEGRPYVEPVERLRRFAKTGKAMQVYSDLLGKNIAVITDESQRSAAQTSGLSVYHVNELIAIVEGRLFDEAVQIEIAKAALDGEVVVA